MDFNHILKQGMEQKNILSQDMQFHMKVLQMSSVELTEFIQEEFIKNPLVEMDESNSDPSILEHDILKALSRKDEYRTERSIISHQNEYVSPLEFISRDRTLTDYLLEQLGLMKLSDKLRVVCEYVIFSLDHRGYFTDSVEHSSEIIGVDSDFFREGLMIVREMEPCGIAWPNVYDTLVFQLDKRGGLTEAHEEIIRKYLPEVGSGNFRKIEMIMKLTEKETQNIVEDIRNVDPIPSRGFADNSTKNFVVPDLRIQKIGSELQITMSTMRVPRLHINEKIREISKENNGEINKYVQEKLQEAIKLIKSIDMRKSTIEKVAEIVMDHQKDYLMDKSNYLKPLSMKTIAEKLEVHESTISRTVRGKYLCTPRGMISLKSLFSINHTASGADILPDYVKTLIKQIIEKEEHTHPFSDQKITEILNENQIEISRRTVAKYREESGIHSSKVRKRRQV